MLVLCNFRDDVMGELSSSGIPCTIIEDLAVGYIMGDVHCVMLGAEGVAESGGIINKVIFDYFWSIRWKKRYTNSHSGLYFYPPTLFLNYR